MDKKLLSALNNLSLALEQISELLSKKGDKKTDTAKALSSGDLSKKFEQLNKSLKDSISKTQEENKKLFKESGLSNITKQFSKIETSLKNLISSNRQLLTMQKNLSQLKPEVIVSKSKIILPKLKPIEIPLRYGKLKQLILPIPKPIEIKIVYNLSKLPVLPKINPQEIRLKYSKIPEIPKFPILKVQEIPLNYGKLPDLPKLAQFEPQEIPLNYGKLPNLPKLAKLQAQEIPVIYGKLPNLPKLAKIQAQEIPLRYGKIPDLPKLAQFEPQEIPLVYGKQPNLPKLAQFEPQEISLFYGPIPNLPKLAQFEPQEIPLVYGKQPNLPKLAKIQNQEIPLVYGKQPALPKLAKIQAQEIPLIYGKLPDLPKLAKIQDQEIPLRYGKLPDLPKLAKIQAQEIPLVYGKQPNLPKLAKIQAQEIPLRYGKIPTKPRLGRLVTQEIPLKYGTPPKFKPPKIAKVMIPTEYEKPRGKITRTTDRDGGLFGKKGVDQNQSRSLKSGLQLIVLMAAGILALGLAFKIIGNINFASVVGLSLAIGILAVSFSKLATVKNLTPKNTLMMVGILVGISLAIMFSSWILRNVRPVGLLQLFTAVMIAGVFSVLSFGLGKLLRGLSRISTRSLIFLPLLPFIMVGISMAITASSYILRGVKPIGFFQAITAILIAGVFSVVSYGLGNLLSSLSRLGLRSIALIPLLPIILVAVAKGIEGSSHILAKVKPIGFFQALTAIFIGIVFAAVGFGLGKILQGLSKVRDKSQALMIAAIMPLVLVAMSAAITLSSHILAKVRPIGFLQALTAIFISVVFVVISYAIPKVAQAVKNLKPEKMVYVPVIMVAMSLAITLSSHIFALIKPVSLSKLMTAVGVAVVISIMGFALGFALNKISRFTQKRIQTGAKNLLVIAATLVATSLILALGQYTKYPSATWTFFTAIGLVIFGGAIIGLDKMKLTFAKVKNGAKSILIIAGLLVATSFILSIGRYTKYPPMQWVFFTAISLVIFAGGILALTRLKLTFAKVKDGAKSILMISAVITATSLILSIGKYNKYPTLSWSLYTAVSLVIFGGAIILLDKMKMDISKVAMGALSIILIAGTITATSLILSKGNYTKYPSMEWTLGVALSMIPFGIAAILLGTFATSGVGAIAMLAGLVSIIAIAGTILATSLILSEGNYTKFPSMDWVLGVAKSMVPFGLAAVVLGPLFPLIALGSLSIIAISYTIKKTSEILASADFSNIIPLEWTINTVAALTPFAAGAVALGVFLPLIPLGSLAVLAVSYLITKTAEILNQGDYKNSIPIEWTKNTIAALTPFALGTVLLGAYLPFVGLGSIAILALSTVIISTAKILSQGDYKNPIPIEWTKATLAALVPFAAGAALLGPLLPFVALGGLSIIGISMVVVKVADILSKGNYRSYPSTEWSTAVSSSMTAFATGMGALGAIITGTLGLGAVALAAGSSAVVLVAETIVKASNILATGNYKDGPSVQWSTAVTSTIGAFANIYKMLNTSSIFDLFFGGGAGPKEFTNSVAMICNAIKQAGESLSGISYGQGPKLEWAQGVGAAISAFGEVYRSLQDSDTFSIFRSGGPTPEEMSQAIISITHGIKVAADNMKAANYSIYPDKKWAKGVGRAVSGFAPVIEAIGKSGFMGFNRISPEEIEKAVLGITKGIVASAKELNQYKGGFGTYPDKDWAKGVSKALTGFSTIFDGLNKNRSWWEGSADPDDYIDAMKAVAQGLVAAATELDNFEGGFKLEKIPSKDWGKNVAGSFIAFIPAIQAVNEADGWFTSGADKIKKNMSAIGESIKNVSISIAGGNYNTVIGQNWIKGLSGALDGFVEVLGSIVDLDPDEDDFEQVNLTVTTLKDISITLSRGNYTTMIDKKWMSNIKSTVESFLSIIGGINELDPDEDDFVKFGTISDTIVTVSNKLKNGNYTTKVDPNWMSNISSTVRTFISLLESVANADFKDETLVSVRSLVNSIVGVSSILTDVKWNSIPKDWMNTIKSNSDVYLSFIDSIQDYVNNEPDEGQDYFIYKYSVRSLIDSIVDITNRLTQGNFNFKIPADYFSNLKRNTDSYLSIVSSITNADFSEYKVERFFKSLIEITKILPQGNFNTMINPDFIPSLEVNVRYYLKIAEAIENSDSDFYTIDDLCRSLVEVSKIITKGNFNFFINPEYVPSLYNNLSYYIKIAKEADGVDTYSTIDLVDSLVKVSNIITKGNFDFFINPEYVPNLYQNVIYYLKIIRAIEESDPDYDYIEDLSYNLVKVSKVISEGKYISLPREYMTNLKKDLLTLVSLLLDLSKMDLDTAVDTIDETIEIAEGISSVSLKLAKGDYTKPIPAEWTKNVGGVLISFSQALNAINSSLSTSLFGGSAVSKAEELADGLIMLANKLAKNRAAFDIRKAPNKNWSQVVGATIQAIIPALNFMSKNDGFLSSGASKFKSSVDALADAMVYFSLKFSKINTNKTINPTFFKNLSDSTKTFLSMVQTIKQSDTDYDTVSKLADSMVELAKAYDKLGDAIGSLNNKMASVDIEKLGVLKNLAGSVVMLSLMDADQFSKMMEELESKASIFLDVVEDTKESTTGGKGSGGTEQKSTTTQSPQTKSNKVGTAGVSTSTVSSPRKQTPDSDKSMSEISKSLDRLANSVAKIQVIVGGPLRNYINSKMSPSGKNSFLLDDD